MDAVKTMKQATAAVAQMEQARKIVAGEESDLLAINAVSRNCAGCSTARTTNSPA